MEPEVSFESLEDMVVNELASKERANRKPSVSVSDVTPKQKAEESSSSSSDFFDPMDARR